LLEVISAFYNAWHLAEEIAYWLSLVEVKLFILEYMACDNISVLKEGGCGTIK